MLIKQKPNMQEFNHVMMVGAGHDLFEDYVIIFRAVFTRVSFQKKKKGNFIFPHKHHIKLLA